MQGFYMSIEWLKEDGSYSEQYLYDCLLDDDAFPITIDRYLCKLKQLNIEVPAPMIRAVLRDKDLNAVNQYKDWGSSHEIVFSA